MPIFHASNETIADSTDASNGNSHSNYENASETVLQCKQINILF